MLLLMSWRHGAYIMRLLWLDVLLRLNLPIWGLKGQTYDGASNVAGKHLGTGNTATSTICTLSSTMCQFGHTSFLGLTCCAKCTLLDTWPWAVWTLAHFLGSLAYLKTSLKPLLQLKGKGPAVSHQAFMSHKVDCALTCYPLLCDGAKCARWDGCKSFSGWRMYMSDCNRVLLLWHICLL